MSICIQLNLKNKQVLIVGGGKVAFRKCQQYMKEEAIVTVVSKTWLPQFLDLPICRIQDEFQAVYLKNKFLVYAATDDLILNETITKLCDRYDILCGSATESAYCSFSSMQQYHHPYVTMAVSTNALAIRLDKELLQQGMKYMMDIYEYKLALLSQIQTMVSNRIYKQIRKEISLFSEHKLEILLQMIHKKKVYVLVYHGVADEQIVMHDTNAFIKEIENEKSVCVSCVASKNVGTYCKEHLPDVFLFDELLFIAKTLEDVDFYFDIVLVRKGKYYTKLAKQCEDVGQIQPFWFPQEIKKEYITRICQKHMDATCVFVLHDYDEEFQRIAQQYQGCCIGLKDQLPEITNTRMHLIPVFMHRGSHFLDDVLHQETGIYGQFVKQNKTVTTEDIPIMEQAWFITLYKDRIKNV